MRRKRRIGGGACYTLQGLVKQKEMDKERDSKNEPEYCLR